MLGLLRRDALWRALLVDQVNPQPGDRVLHFGRDDGPLVRALSLAEPACQVIEPDLANPFGSESDPPVSPGDAPNIVWTDTGLNDESIKRFRPYNKAVGVFPARGLPARSAEQLLAAVRHGLPAEGELHLVEFSRPHGGRSTVEALLRKAGFKVVEQKSALPSLLGRLELFKALKQPGAAVPRPEEE